MDLLEAANAEAIYLRNEIITPEHILLILLQDEYFLEALRQMEVDIIQLQENVKRYMDTLDTIPDGVKTSPIVSVQLEHLIKMADVASISCGKNTIEILHIVKEILRLQDSYAAYFLNEAIRGEVGDFLNVLMIGEPQEDDDVLDDDELNEYDSGFSPQEEFDFLNADYENNPLDDPRCSQKQKNKKEDEWKKLVVCINDIYKNHNPLIGREEELRKTIRILCRKEKNNPLHIGEPGVGKTALIYGLARKIEDGEVPGKLKDAKIYRIDLGSLIAGTQFRGDFEKRIKTIMDGVAKEKNAIIYIDEIHNLVGAGAVGESSMDASNILKPYLETGNIRFIGATTYDEYKRQFAKSKSIIRRFSNIDILEPSVDDTIGILNQLQPLYEEFHNVKYSPEAIEYAVRASAKYINDRFLPDKAIDLMDESGATRQIEASSNNDMERVVDKELVSEVLAKICKVESLAISEEDPKNLEKLEERISSQLFGQERAVREVSESILMSKAGLSDENKPLASLLFVGPTGVGKTELAKLLAQELDVELIRFDMSEYTEKHTVAKLIGSPAGYVGYEDGGLLTDAIRKNPNAVLLLDEIEKAHSDIYNILLQVMDYARLTDNKGNKADFRNVVLIMTSNAGAQFAAQANVGFASSFTQGDVMMKQVKRTFKPEFINRLSATVVFNDMNRDMASLILNKKLKELSNKLKSRNVSLFLEENARDFLLEKGFTKEYGARELDRVIQHELKRLLMKEILFGFLKDGGEVRVNKYEDVLKLWKN